MQNKMKSSKSITAVEWLVDYIEKLNKSGYEFHPKYNEDIVQQAKEMEKQQMRSSFVGCWITNIPYGIKCKVDFDKWFEQYKKK
jgi:hypothetical protein